MKQDERTPVYTEGVCGDGAMILRDGQPFPIPSIIDALNAYTSTEALREGLRGWQPIETAPKDGTSILACVAGASVPVIAKWVVTPRHGKWVAADEDDFDSMEDWAEYVSAHDFPATHWMPLPPAPDAARTALAGVTAPTTRSFNEHMVEDLIVAAYKRGFIWANHNPVDGEFLDKAARDYADYTMNGPTVGTGAATSTAGVTGPSEVAK